MSTIPQIELDLRPRSLVFDPPITDMELEAFCAQNDHLRIERTRDGVLHMNPPTSRGTTRSNGEITGRLYQWWLQHERGEMTDSSGGFYLRDGSMLSPDAAYILPETLGKITHQRPTGFYPTHPDFVIELLSPSDSLTEAQAKMETWLENGVQLGWLIVPSRKEVHIYQQGQPLRVFNGKTLTAPHPVEGFSLDLTRLWRYYES